MAEEGHFDLRTIFDDNAAYVWRALRHLGVSEADLPDQSQEVFITLHRKLDSFEQRSALKTWIYGICLRVASDYRRRAYNRREVPTEEPPARTVQPSQIEHIEREQARALLRAVLDELDEHKRQVFVLFELEGMLMKDVASLVGCPVQTAFSRLRAARVIVERELALRVVEEP